MKSINQIIDHIVSTPGYSKLQDLKEVRDFISLLGKNKNSIIHHAFCKNQTLFIAVIHPAFKQELGSDSSIFQIKSLLKIYCKTHQNSILTSVQDIKFIVCKPPEKPQNLKREKKDYSYLSKGEFTNLATTSPIKEMFDKIKQDLKNAYR